MPNKISKYQKSIVTRMREHGAVLDCSEGADYCAWLRYPDGRREIVRRDSVDVLASRDALCNWGTRSIKVNPYFKID